MDYESVKRLLASGADVNEPDADFAGARPLHISIDIECEESCRRYDLGEADAEPLSFMSALLLESGASPHLLDSAGQSPIDWAKRRSHKAALILFDKIT